MAPDSARRTPRKQSRTPPGSFHRPSRNGENQSARGSKVLNDPPLRPRANNRPGHKAHRKHNVESKPLEPDIHITKGPDHDRAHGVPNPRQAPQSDGRREAARKRLHSKNQTVLWATKAGKLTCTSLGSIHQPLC
ncbi:unnamed protein product [Sphagnum jensenii]|uniref:Uncharacterized protein n=1 Tax=Sphagnum jensenii TaxID=128206 RepID=A0ABP0X259_9BRYO